MMSGTVVSGSQIYFTFASFMTLKFVSWNVNGVRAVAKKGLVDSVRKLDPDFLLIQETKAPKEEALNALALLSDFRCYVNSSKARKGYSGTAILTKSEPIAVNYDLGIEKHDQEGRVILLEYSKFYLVCVYVPNSGSGLKRLDYRKEWDLDFKRFLGELNSKKPVIVGGDLNVAHKEIDIARAKQNYNVSSGYTQAEIDGLQGFLNLGLTDSFRFKYPEEIVYSYWNVIFNSRERNVGWRIDYFLVSEKLKSHISEARIHNDVYGSDHCPVSVEIEV